MTTLERARPLPVEPEEHITLLDVYAENGVAEVSPRIDSLGTISAGDKAQNAKAPTISRDGTIHLHDPEGRASGLAAALSATDRKQLTIAFPFDEWDSVVQMRFAEYSASRLLAYGDQHGITTIAESGERQHAPAGTPEFEALKRRCKVTVNVYFVLAAWQLPNMDGPGVVFPDGLGFYRLRFTSRNSLQNLLNAWKLIKKLSGGRIAGVPLDLQLVNREVAAPNGTRRSVPVWTFTMKPPQGFQLSSRNFQATLGKALEAGRELVLPAPDAEEIDAAFALPAPDQDEAQPLSEREERELASGFNADRIRREYFAITEGTPFRERPGRAELIEAATAAFYQGESAQVTGSLSAVLDRADQALADYVLLTAREWVKVWRVDSGPLNGADAEKLRAYVAKHQPGVNVLDFANHTLQAHHQALTALSVGEGRAVMQAAKDKAQRPTT